MAKSGRGEISALQLRTIYIRIMKQRIKEFCDEYMWFILPACSVLAIMLGVVLEKHFPLSEIL